MRGWAKDFKRPAIPTPLHPLERPVILCEYSHAMGNSNGSLHDYFRVFKTMPGIQGGFIWEWLDHGILQKTEDGRSYHAYGGDFGDVPNNANFVCDGMVSADRQPHPAMWEFKHLAQPVTVELVDAKRGIIRVRNEKDFTSLKALAGRWELLENGVITHTGKLPMLDTAPGATEEVTLELPAVKPSVEVHLNVRFATTADTLYAKNGHEVAFNQLQLAEAVAEEPKRASEQPAVAVEESQEGVKLSAGELTLRFARQTGTLESISKGGMELLARGPLLQLWRAATDNDGIKLWTGQDYKALGRWQKLGLDKPLTHNACRFEWAANEDGSATVTLSHSAWAQAAKNNALHTHRYTLHPDGRLVVDNEVVLTGDEMTDLPRVGIRIDLVPGYEQLRYFGRGPWENYSDRKASAMLGEHEGPVSDEYVLYVMPQEHGHHTDVRWLELRAREGRPRVHISSRKPFEMNVTHYSAEHLYESKHTTELKPSSETIVYIDAAHRGLGTSSCGPDTLEAYRVSDRQYRFSYEITLIQ
jgi:beta-galactosidase